MLDIQPQELVFRGASAGSPHKMKSKLHVYNPTHSTIFYRVCSSHSIYYSLYVSPISGKLLPGQSVDIHFVLPSIASVRHSAHPLRFVLQCSAAAPNSDLRTFWKYVDILDVVETQIRARMLFDETAEAESSTSEDESGWTYLPPARKSTIGPSTEEDTAAACSFEESRNDVILRLITENRSLRARLLSLEKAVGFYEEAMQRHAELIDENARLRERTAKLEQATVPFNCCICLEEKPNTIVYPCRHIILCKGCASQCGNKCPMCRTTIVQKALVYF